MANSTESFSLVAASSPVLSEAEGAAWGWLHRKSSIKNRKSLCHCERTCPELSRRSEAISLHHSLFLVRHSIFTTTFAFLLMLSNIAAPAYAKYGGGTGEPNDPYLIFDANQMNAIGADSNDWDKHFILMADIDLAAFTGTSFNIIGNLDTKFTGVFDGNRHTISNFTYTSSGTNFVGLFGYVYGTNAEIKELGLQDPDINAGSGFDVGSVAGELGFYAKMTACYAQGGSVAGYIRIGGLVGTSNGNITYCHSTTSATGNSSVGGLVGYNRLSGRIRECYSTGIVTGTHDTTTGGLVGWNDGGRIYASFWDTETSSQTYSRGGTGKTTAEMQDPNTFMEAGWDFVGQPDRPHDIWAEPAGGGYPILWWQVPPQFGLPSFSGGTGQANDPYLISTAIELNQIGHNPRLMQSHFRLINDIELAGVDFYIIGGSKFSPYELYPFAGVFDGNDRLVSNFTYTSTDRDKVGLFGYIDGMNAQVKNLVLKDPNIFAGTKYYVGTLAGYLECGLISNIFVQDGKISASGTYIGGLVGQTEGKITDCRGYISVSEAGLTGGDHVGGLTGCNHGMIENCTMLGDIVAGSYIGGLAGKNYASIIHCHSMCTIEAFQAAGGLVGINEGTIADCSSIVSISDGISLGGLVGKNRAEISNCSSEGSVTSYVIDTYVNLGGLAGYNSGTISGSYSSASVVGFESAYQAGGLIGVNTGQVTNCYSLGGIEVGYYLGGLIGVNVGPISNCYSAGAVTPLRGMAGGLLGYNNGTITTSFWDTDTSGQTQMCGTQDNGGTGCDDGSGKTTAEMQTISTFTDADWDFVNIWDICEGTNYPRFIWQIFAADFLCPDGVTMVDYSFFASHWMEDNCGASNDCEGTDLDFSDAVDDGDLKIFCYYWLAGL